MPRLKGESLISFHAGVPHRFEPTRQPPLAAVCPSLSKERTGVSTLRCRRDARTTTRSRDSQHCGAGFQPAEPLLIQGGERRIFCPLWRRSRHEGLQKNLPKSTVLFPGQVSKMGALL